MPFFDVNTTHKIKISENGYLTGVMSLVFNQFRKMPLPESIQCPAELLDFVKLVYAGANQESPEISIDSTDVISDFLEFDNRPVYIGFSGGKDSLATAILCEKEQSTPVLYYVKGLNRAYPSEYDCVLELAERTGFQLVISNVSQLGEFEFKESPVKDQLILSMMVDHGKTRGACRYTMGVEKTNRAATSNIAFNWSDSVEMFELVNSWISTHFPQYVWTWYVKNHSHSLRIISDYDFNLLHHTISCLTPYRFQDLRRRQTLEKFGDFQLPRRCGNCWKCCVEYINLIGLHRAKFDPRFFKHCFEKFKASLNIAYGQEYLSGAPDVEILKVAADPTFVDFSAVQKGLYA